MADDQGPDSERLFQIITALYDHLSREGATAHSASAALKKQGFSAAEIALGANLMLQGAEREKDKAEYLKQQQEQQQK